MPGGPDGAREPEDRFAGPAARAGSGRAGSGRTEADVVELLHAAGSDLPGPDEATVARMRARLMTAIAEEADGPTPTTPTPTPLGGGVPTPRRSGTPVAPARPRRAVGADRTRPAASRTRPAAARDRAPGAGTRPGRRPGQRPLSRTGAIVATLAVLGVLVLVIGNRSLPGDPLYGVKRATESSELALTSGQESQARAHLALATRRLDEITELIDRPAAWGVGTHPSAAGMDARTSGLVAANLRAFESETRQGMWLMLPLVTDPRGPSAAELEQWSRDQNAHLESLAPSLSAADRGAVDASRDLVEKVRTRAVALGERKQCSTAVAGHDDLGPIPAGGTCLAPTTPSPAAVAPGRTGVTTEPARTTAPTTSPAPGSPGTGGNREGPRAPVAPAAPGAPSPAAPVAPGPAPGPLLPPVPLPLPPGPAVPLPVDPGIPLPLPGLEVSPAVPVPGVG